jgi:DNA ligase-1
MSVLLAKPFTGQNVVGWWQSEKFDGMRAWWDGIGPRNRFTGLWSRDGKIIHCPRWFTEGFPNWPLDGELYIRRNTFQLLMTIVRRQMPEDDHWRLVNYMVFDSPQYVLPFEAAKERILQWQGWGDWVRVVEHTRVTTQPLEELSLAEGMEGLMYRKPGSYWMPIRSDILLKHKVTRTGVATVVGWREGTGKHEGRMGALTVAWNGVVFDIGTGFTDDERAYGTFEVGQAVNFKYRELTDAGIPKEARYVR